MKIRELHLKNFGKFSDEKITFHDGVNLFYGENESGKTTIHTFIKSMLFGLERGRGRAALNDTFSLYEPWENPNYYSGKMRFESGGKIFSLERTFDKYSKKASLICEDDGEEFSLSHGDLEVLLGGLEVTSYEDTIAIGQMKVEPNQTLATSLQSYATNYYTTGNGDINLNGALNLLNTRKKDVEKEIREMLQEKQQKRSIIEQECNYIWRDIHKIETELEDVEQKIETVEAKKAEQENYPVSKWRIHPGVIAGMIAALIVVFFAFNQPWNYLITVVLSLAECLFFWNRLKDGKRKTQEELLEEIGAILDKLNWQKERLQEEVKEKQILYNNLQEKIDELEEMEDGYKNLNKKKQALEIAHTQLAELARGVYREFSMELNRTTSEILKEITGGKYSMIMIDDKLKMHLYTGEKKIGIDQVSRGTIEQIYFALRMAASHILFDDEYPVILDDTFVYYDDVRLENTLKWLVKNKKQIIIFTCQKREEEILKKLGAL